MDTNINICRLCLKYIGENAPYTPLKHNNSVLQSLNLISFSTIKNLQLTKNPIICEQCFKKLMELARFKENIISNEFKIQCSQRGEENCFLKSLSEDINKICRLCLQIPDNCSELKRKWKCKKVLINNCNIHLNMDISNPSKICLKCDMSLQDLGIFIFDCAENEKRIVNFASRKGILELNDLKEMIRLESTDVQNKVGTVRGNTEEDNNNSIGNNKLVAGRKGKKLRANSRKSVTDQENFEETNEINLRDDIFFCKTPRKTYKRASSLFNKKLPPNKHRDMTIESPFFTDNITLNTSIDADASSLADVTLTNPQDYNPVDNGVQELTDLLDLSEELENNNQSNKSIEHVEDNNSDIIIMQIEVQSNVEGSNERQNKQIAFEVNFLDITDELQVLNNKRIIKKINLQKTEFNNDQKNNENEPIILNSQMKCKQSKLQLKVKPAKHVNAGAQVPGLTLKRKLDNTPSNEIDQDSGLQSEVKKYRKIETSNENLTNTNLKEIEKEVVPAPIETSSNTGTEETQVKESRKTIVTRNKALIKNDIDDTNKESKETSLLQAKNKNLEAKATAKTSKRPQRQKRNTTKKLDVDNNQPKPDDVTSSAINSSKTQDSCATSSQLTTNECNTSEHESEITREENNLVEKPFDVTIIRRTKRNTNKAELDETWQKLTGKAVKQDKKDTNVGTVKIPKKRGRKPKADKVKQEKAPHLQCSCCPFKTYSQNSFIQHQYIHNVMDTVAQHKCTQCPFMTSNEELLTQHQINHMSTNLSFKCVFCDYSNKKKISIMNHILRHDDKDVANMFYCVVQGDYSMDEYFECFQCDFQSTDEAGMPDHVIDHNRSVKIKNPVVAMFSCNQCRYKTKMEDLLHRHQELKHGGKGTGSGEEENIQCKQEESSNVYKCDLCSYMTLHKRSLSNHKSMKHFRKKCEKKESGETYFCAECPYATTRKIYLARHAMVHKTKDNMEYFECPHCYFETKHRRSYTRHMEVRHQVIV